MGITRVAVLTGLDVRRHSCRRRGAAQFPFDRRASGQGRHAGGGEGVGGHGGGGDVSRGEHQRCRCASPRSRSCGRTPWRLIPRRCRVQVRSWTMISGCLWIEGRDADVRGGALGAARTCQHRLHRRGPPGSGLFQATTNGLAVRQSPAGGGAAWPLRGHRARCGRAVALPLRAHAGRTRGRPVQHRRTNSAASCFRGSRRPVLRRISGTSLPTSRYRRSYALRCRMMPPMDWSRSSAPAVTPTATSRWRARCPRRHRRGSPVSRARATIFCRTGMARTRAARDLPRHAPGCVRRRTVTTMLHRHGPPRHCSKIWIWCCGCLAEAGLQQIVWVDLDAAGIRHTGRSRCRAWTGRPVDPGR